MSCLCIVVDCDARNWGALVEREGDYGVFYSLLSAIASFASAHLSLSANNSVSILGVDATLNNPLLYAFDLTIQIDMTPTIVERLRMALLKSAGNSDAKCTSQFAPAFATAFCHINRFKKENDGADGRILIINIGSDLAREQNALMNVFFSAHKQGIVVDVANIGEPSPVLQQACDITMGAYINVEKPKRLLQYLMFFALGGPDSRSKFTSSVASSVDYRASCHCHGTPASIALVCSVCLSVQCKFNPICPICNTVFKIPGRGRRSRKRRHED
uniref:General transcription factor IIH subunit 3 n=1 Tax=Ascaris suum TaxID=6253 RepID=F1L0H3_ASCSU